MTKEDFQKQEIEILISLTGMDDTFNQTVHARFSYNVENILIDRKFVDMIQRTDEGKLIVSLEKISEMHPN